MKKKTTMENEIFIWLDNIGQMRLKQSTYYMYKYRIEKYILPYFEEIELADIKFCHVQDFILELAHDQSKKKLSARTIRGIFTIMNSFFKYSVSTEKITKNPCTSIVLPIADKAVSVVILTKDEKRLIMNDVIKEKSNRSLLVLVALFTGMRIGELCSLKWENVDFENMTIKVSATIQRIRVNDQQQKTRVIIDTPKSRNSFRMLPLSQFVSELLAELYANKNTVGSEFVFCKRNGQCYDIRGIQKYYAKMTKSLMIKKPSFHCLRHTYATMAIEAGIDAKTLSILLGHSNVMTTLNLYVHPDEEYIRERVEIITNYMNEITLNIKKIGENVD